MPLNLYKYFGLLLIVVSYSATAQILEEDAAFADKARGKELFTLKRGQAIYTYQPDDGWYKARKLVFIKAEDISEKRLRAGADLYDLDEQKIGQAQEALRLFELDTVEVFRGDSRYKAVIEGWVFKTKLEERSIPEQELGRILALKNRTEQGLYFEELWEATGAERREFSEFVAYAIKEVNKTSQEEQDFRLVMIFRGETTPYAVISNAHEITVPKVKDRWEDGDFTVQYLFKPSSSQKETIEEILFTFLAL
jgi:hypothetical protein